MFFKTTLTISEDQGFTLVEIIAVVTIIGILVAIVTPKHLVQVEKARVGQTLTELQAMKVALEIHAASNMNTYPEAVGDVQEVLMKFGISNLTDPWGSSYYYGVKNQQKDFIVYSHGPNQQAGGGDDIIAIRLISPLAGQSADTYNYPSAQELYVN